MAKDQTQVAIDLASGCVEQTGILVNALLELDELQDWRTGARITDFAAYESEIQAQGPTEHTDGAMLNKLLGTIYQDVLTYLNTTTVSTGPYSGNTYLELIQMARRS